MNNYRWLLRDPDTGEIVPEGSASLVEWIKAAVRCIHSEKRDCPPRPMNAKWITPEEAAGFMMTRIFTH